MRQSTDLTSSHCWHNLDKPKLWRYHLHYFHDLNTPNGLNNTTFWHARLDDWQAQNPLWKGDGWEPYPLSLRIVNWILWHCQTKQFDQNLIDNLYLQCLALEQQIEWHIDGNHLWSNGKALLFASLFFETKTNWYIKGLNIVAEVLDTQILSSGAHSELSPMYHAIVLNDLLELIHIHHCYTKTYPSAWDDKASHMLGYLSTLTHPDGEYAFFNDCALDIAPTLSTLTRAAKLLNIVPKPQPTEHYHRFQNQAYTVILDTADIACPFQPGHAHADTLSFELSIGEQRVLVNSGTSDYDNNDQRRDQRSTMAHNTVSIDNENSSEVWHAFRVAKRAAITHREWSTFYAIGEHDGYSRIHKDMHHRRKWQFGEHCIYMTDTISGHGVCNIDLHLHCHPTIFANIENGRVIFSRDEQPIVSITFPPDCHIEINNSKWHPRFGEAIDNQSIQVSFKSQSLPHTVPWTIELAEMESI